MSFQPGAPTPFLLGPASDLFFLGPGATVLGSALFLALVAAGGSVTAGLLATAFTLTFSGAHYAATYRRAYSSLEIVRNHPLVTLVAPLLLAAAGVAALRFPATIAPLYFLLYVVWAGYHYSGQSLGLAMLYPLRQGSRLETREKRLLAFPLYVSWLLSLLGLMRLDSSTRNPAYLLVRQNFFGVHLPGWALVAGVVALVLSFSSVALLAIERRRRGLPLPWPVYGVILAQVIWFGWGLFYPLFNIVLVPVFHALQYLALTSWHHCKGRGASGPRAFVVYAMTVLMLGLLINPGLFLIFDGVAGDPLVVSAVLITFVNLHHFLMDGRIWRLRERKVVESFVEPATSS